MREERGGDEGGAGRGRGRSREGMRGEGMRGGEGGRRRGHPG